MPRDDDATGTVLWLASYPRSGSTWLRIILTLILGGQAKAHNSVVPSFHNDYPLDVLLSYLNYAHLRGETQDRPKLAARTF